MKNNDTNSEILNNPLSPNSLDETPQSRKGKLIIAGSIFIILIIAGSAFAFLQMKHKKEAEEQAKIEAQKQDDLIFTDVDDIVVNLDTRGKGISFLKLKVALQVKGKTNSDNVIRLMPKIRDVMQTYLRELRPSDLSGSYGLYKLREELLLRINAIVYPTQVDDLLFKDVLIQ